MRACDIWASCIRVVDKYLTKKFSQGRLHRFSRMVLTETIVRLS